MSASLILTGMVLYAVLGLCYKFDVTNVKA